MLRSIFTLSVCAVLVFGGFLIADEKKDPPKDPPKPKGMLPANWGKLGLTEEQKDKIYKVQATFKPQIEEMEKKLDELKAKEKADMVKVLTPEQKKKLQDLLIGDDKKPDEKKP